MIEATFTNEEKDRINNLYVNGFEDITPDDAELIGRWEAYKAQQDAEFQAKLDAIREENEMRLQQAQTVYETAIDNLNALANAAIARFERLNDGKA